MFKRSINHASAIGELHKTKIWVSTNIQEILSSANQQENLTILKRPENLCGDEVLTIDVIKNIINNCNFSNEDIILLLQPTSPFRNIKEISNSINLIKENKCESVVSLAEVEGNHPFRMKRLTSSGECINFIDQGFEDMRPRQSLQKFIFVLETST